MLIYNTLLGSITVSIQLILSTITIQLKSGKLCRLSTPSRAYVISNNSTRKSNSREEVTSNNSAINAYVQGFPTRFDQVALLGKPYDLEDEIYHILEGVQEEYKSIVDQIEGRKSTPTIVEIHEKVLNHEAKMQSKSSTIVPITANAVTYRNPSNGCNNCNNFKGHRNNNNGSRNQQTWQLNNNVYSHYDQPTRGYQGRCQLCGIHGHSARRCSQLQNVNAAFNSKSCKYSPQSNSWQPRANLVTTQSYNPNNWIMDSGATHHLTTNLYNLSPHQPYTRGKEVTIAYSSALPISHTGYSYLKTSPHSFVLQDVLYALKLQKILYLFTACVILIMCLLNSFLHTFR